MTSGRNATSNQPQHVNVVQKQRSDSPSPTPDMTAHSNAFVGMALTMSWQLAIVVLLPILGGHFIDVRQHSAPWFTLAGLGLAIIGVFGVLAKTVADANERVNGVKQ